MEKLTTDLTPQSIHPDDIPVFDIAKYLDCVLQDNDAELLVAALGHVARARGMAKIAEQTGISREALYRALKPNKKPRFETISKVCAALGLRLTVQSTLSPA